MMHVKQILIHDAGLSVNDDTDSAPDDLWVDASKRWVGIHGSGQVWDIFRGWKGAGYLRRLEGYFRQTSFFFGFFSKIITIRLESALI